MSHQYFDRDRDPRGGEEGGRAEYQDNNHRQQHRRPYHSPAAPEYSKSLASTTGGYSRHAGGERGKSRDERGAYSGAERPYEQHVNHRRRGERDWDRSAGGDIHSERDWEREGQEGRNDWDTDRVSSRDNYSSREGRGVSSGGGYRDRDRPRSRSQSQSRSHSHNRDNSYRDRDNYWDRGDRDLRDRDRDRDSRDNRDNRDSRDRDRSPFFGAPPCRDVILEGFGFEISEDDILKELEELGVEGVETMHIIKDRNTGLSRGFGFARFSTIALAKKFLSDFFPSLRMFADGTRVNCAFSRTGGGGNEDRDRGRRGRDGDDEWTCRVCLMLNFSRRTECYRCGTPKSEVTLTGHLTHPTPTFFQNDGSRDVEETTVSQFLLFRELAEGVGEEMLAKGVQKLLAPSPNLVEHVQGGPKNGTTAVEDGAREGSVKRVLLIRDRRTDESWRFGFVEFTGVEDSKAAFEKYQKMEKFTIASKPVAVSFIHSGVFVPVYNPHSKAKNLEKYTFLGSTGLRLAYWDEEGYVSELAVAQRLPSDAPTTTTSEREKGESSSKGKKRKAEAEKPGAGATSAAAAGAKKTLPSHLQFWQDRHMELHGVVAPQHNSDGESGAASDESTKKLKKKKVVGATAMGVVPGLIPEAEASAGAGAVASAETGGDGPPSESFADLNRLACLLCARQFKSAQEVHKHERISTLHRSNLADEKLVAKAREKLEKAGIKQAVSADASAATAPVYRDRAKERRAVFGQPKRPEPVSKDPPVSAKDTSVVAQPPSPPPAPSKGAALLSKMGWTSGAGLGAEGRGITAPVVAEMYAEGVGLGAKGGKVGEASEVSALNTSGAYKDFVRRTKEKAKERYEEMS